MRQSFFSVQTIIKKSQRSLLWKTLQPARAEKTRPRREQNILFSTQIYSSSSGVEQAARIPGAAVLRVSQEGSTGHIVLSDGKGGTIEAHSSKDGVKNLGLANRRWDIGILVPWISYTAGIPVPVPAPDIQIYRLTSPMMKGEKVREIQQKLEEMGYPPGPPDGWYGRLTAAAVGGFQLSHGLTVDREVGPLTAAALGVSLPSRLQEAPHAA
jgi:hypothetical protein